MSGACVHTWFDYQDLPPSQAHNQLVIVVAQIHTASHSLQVQAVTRHSHSGTLNTTQGLATYSTVLLDFVRMVATAHLGKLFEGYGFSKHSQLSQVHN